MDERERGRPYCRARQIDHDPDLIPVDSPEWQKVLLDYAAQRDRMKRLAAQGNEEAARQGRYLDGFLSVWD